MVVELIMLLLIHIHALALVLPRVFAGDLMAWNPTIDVGSALCPQDEIAVVVGAVVDLATHMEATGTIRPLERDTEVVIHIT